MEKLHEGMLVVRYSEVAYCSDILINSSMNCSLCTCNIKLRKIQLVGESGSAD